MELLDISRNQELQNSIPESIIKLETVEGYRRVLPHVIAYNRQSGFDRAIFRAIELEEVLTHIEGLEDEAYIADLNSGNDTLSEKYPLIAITADEADRAAGMLVRSGDQRDKLLGVTLNQYISYIERRKLFQQRHSPRWVEGTSGSNEDAGTSLKTRPATPQEILKFGALALAS